MSFLLDTDVVAATLKGRERESKLLQHLSSQPLFISLVTYGEIYEGIYFGQDSSTNEQTFRLFLRNVDVLPLSKVIMKHFARLRGTLRAKGNLIPDADLLIAATAINHNLTLITRNTRHFERIPGLMLYK